MKRAPFFLSVLLLPAVFAHATNSITAQAINCSYQYLNNTYNCSLPSYSQQALPLQIDLGVNAECYSNQWQYEFTLNADEGSNPVELEISNYTEQSYQLDFKKTDRYQQIITVTPGKKYTLSFSGSTCIPNGIVLNFKNIS